MSFSSEDRFCRDVAQTNHENSQGTAKLQNPGLAGVLYDSVLLQIHKIDLVHSIIYLSFNFF